MTFHLTYKNNTYTSTIEGPIMQGRIRCMKRRKRISSHRHFRRSRRFV